MIGIGKGAVVVDTGPEVGSEGRAGVKATLGSRDGDIVPCPVGVAGAVVGLDDTAITGAMVGSNVMLAGVGEGVTDASKKVQTPLGGGTSSPCVTTNRLLSFARRSNHTAYV